MGTEKRGKVSLWTLCGILLGLLLLLFPEFLIRGLALICGAVCAVFGIRRILSGFRGDRFRRGSVFVGIAAFLCGLYLSLHAEQIVSLLPIGAGILFLADGIGRVGLGLSLRRQRTEKYWIAFVFGVLLMLAGTFLILFPFFSVTVTVRIVGAFILCDAIADLWAEYVHRKAETPRDYYERIPFDGTYEAQFRDITDDK